MNDNLTEKWEKQDDILSKSFFDYRKSKKIRTFFQLEEDTTSLDIMFGDYDWKTYIDGHILKDLLIKEQWILNKDSFWFTKKNLPTNWADIGFLHNLKNVHNDLEIRQGNNLYTLFGETQPTEGIVFTLQQLSFGRWKRTSTPYSGQQKKKFDMWYDDDECDQILKIFNFIHDSENNPLNLFNFLNESKYENVALLIVQTLIHIYGWSINPKDLTIEESFPGNKRSSFNINQKFANYFESLYLKTDNKEPFEKLVQTIFHASDVRYFSVWITPYSIPYALKIPFANNHAWSGAIIFHEFPNNWTRKTLLTLIYDQRSLVALLDTWVMLQTFMLSTLLSSYTKEPYYHYSIEENNMNVNLKPKYYTTSIISNKIETFVSLIYLNDSDNMVYLVPDSIKKTNYLKVNYQKSKYSWLYDLYCLMMKKKTKSKKQEKLVIQTVYRSIYRWFLALEEMK